MIVVAKEEVSPVELWKTCKKRELFGLGGIDSDLCLAYEVGGLGVIHIIQINRNTRKICEEVKFIVCETGEVYGELISKMNPDGILIERLTVLNERSIQAQRLDSAIRIVGAELERLMGQIITGGEEALRNSITALVGNLFWNR